MFNSIQTLLHLVIQLTSRTVLQQATLCSTCSTIISQSFDGFLLTVFNVNILHIFNLQIVQTQYYSKSRHIIAYCSHVQEIIDSSSEHTTSDQLNTTNPSIWHIWHNWCKLETKIIFLMQFKMLENLIEQHLTWIFLLHKNKQQHN